MSILWINPLFYGHLVFNNSAKTIPWGRNSPSIKDAGTISYPLTWMVALCKRMRLDSHLTPYTKINSKLHCDLTITAESTKILWRKNRSKSLWFWTSFHYNTNSTSNKEKRMTRTKWKPVCFKEHHQENKKTTPRMEGRIYKFYLRRDRCPDTWRTHNSGSEERTQSETWASDPSTHLSTEVLSVRGMKTKTNSSWLSPSDLFHFSCLVNAQCNIHVIYYRLYTWNLHNLINQGHPNTFNKKF